ncbi:MAG TPA: helix-turn-helix domain-containing protein [Acidimicrobiales bacterium]|nr:helix-turn-helix domain-containing protein [Acidimicrobiales bacterium]
MTLAIQTAPVHQPLPLVPQGSVRISDAVWLSEDAQGAGAVFVWGQVTWSWSAGDLAMRKLAAVQLVNIKAAFQRHVASAFGVDEDTLILWRRRYEELGVEGLVPRRLGPKGPSKLTEDKRAEIVALREEGLSQTEVARRAGVSQNMVSRALAAARTARVSSVAPGGSEGPCLEPLARPVPRTAERQAARAGLLMGAEPVVTEGASLPLAGALLVLPALAATGLLDAATSLYGSARAAYYGVRSLVLCIVFAALLGEPRAEGLTRLDPVDVGRLIGLDRVPEVKTLRRRMEELAGLGRADRLLDALARHHLARGGAEVSGLFYVDGHVRAYHGDREIQKAHVARARLAMPAVADTWVTDRFGDGLLVWEAASSSLVSELKKVVATLRALVGNDARPTICFDRGGWSPKLFKELSVAGFHLLTYRKAPLHDEPRTSFSLHVFSDDRGKRHEYWLADRQVAISYANKRRRLVLRQITRLDPKTGHQTQILTTRDDEDPALLAHLMFSRWREENFFRYMRAHFGLDALDSYATATEDPERLVANPTRKQADKELAAARRSLQVAESAQGKAAFGGRPADSELRRAFRDAQAEVDRLAQAAKAVPAKVPLSEARPEMVRLASERKRIMDAIRMATYNAESALARLLAPHYARADDEARTLLREMFRASADLEVKGDELHVAVNHLSAARRTRAMAALCDELTSTKTRYPGTELTLVYSVKATP